MKKLAKKVAMVVSTVGFHWEEVAGAYREFRKAGWQVEFFTVDGRPPKADPVSLKKTGPLSLLGLGTPSSIAPATRLGQELQKELAGVRPVSELKPENFDTLYLPGGHGCLFDVNRDPVVHRVIEALYQENKLMAGVCHATSTFSFARSGGASIVQGKAMTGFPELMDTVLAKVGAVDRGFLPIPFSNDAALEKAGARLGWYPKLMATLFPAYMRKDLPFITGMGPKAAGRVARALIAEVERKSEK